VAHKLFLAIQEGDFSTVEQLVSNKAVVLDLNSEYIITSVGLGITDAPLCYRAITTALQAALHLAILYLREDMVRFLVERGADVNTTAEHCSIVTNKPRIVEDSYECTPLHMVVLGLLLNQEDLSEEKIKIAERIANYLIENNANISIKTGDGDLLGLTIRSPHLTAKELAIKYNIKELITLFQAHENKNKIPVDIISGEQGTFSNTYSMLASTPLITAPQLLVPQEDALSEYKDTNTESENIQNDTYSFEKYYNSSRKHITMFEANTANTDETREHLANAIKDLRIASALINTDTEKYESVQQELKTLRTQLITLSDAADPNRPLLEEFYSSARKHVTMFEANTANTDEARNHLATAISYLIIISTLINAGTEKYKSIQQEIKTLRAQLITLSEATHSNHFSPRGTV
jgi:hypothetical protein